MSRILGSPAKLLLLATFAALFIAAIFWKDIIFASAVASSESRPELLRDADWGAPDPSFQKRFSPGANETELLRWLSENGFELDGTSGASRRIQGLPCNEIIDVSWTAIDGTISESSAVVREAGCL